jgi:hypothetical protein
MVECIAADEAKCPLDEIHQAIGGRGLGIPLEFAVMTPQREGNFWRVQPNPMAGARRNRYHALEAEGSTWV